jgi:hypothetical protein
MGTSKSPQRRSQHNLIIHLVIIIYIQCRLPIYTFWGYIIIKRNADMACWFYGKIRDLHPHFYSFLEPLHIKKYQTYLLKIYQSIINHCLPVRRPVEVDIIISHSTIVVDDNIHCSSVINSNFLLLISDDIDPVKPSKKNILMA